MSLRDMRVHYDIGTLKESDLAAAPLMQFQTWFEAAVAAELPEVNAMVVATVGVTEAGTPQPSARTVLLKEADGRGFAGASLRPVPASRASFRGSPCIAKWS